MDPEFKFEPFPSLSTERMKLVRMSLDHADALFELRRHDDVMQYIERPRPQQVSDIHDLIRSNDELIETTNGIAWVMIEKATGTMIGTIGYWRMKKEHHRAEIGYMMFPEFWGKGLMSEAIQEVLKYGFDVMKLHSVEADINPDNDASAKILERNGFVREAFFRENYFWNGIYLNSAIYGLLVSDFRKQLKS